MKKKQWVLRVDADAPGIQVARWAALAAVQLAAQSSLGAIDKDVVLVFDPGGERGRVAVGKLEEV